MAVGECMEGLSGNYICKVLGTNADQSMLHRCRVQLRRCTKVNWIEPGVEGD